MLRGEFLGRRVLWPNGETAGPLAVAELPIFPVTLPDGDVGSGLGDLAPTPEDERSGGRDERGADCRADDGAPHFHFRISPFSAGNAPAMMMSGAAMDPNT